GRGSAGSLDGRTQTLPAIYSFDGSDFVDIKSGRTSTGGTTFNAGAGYDLVTGRGSPVPGKIVGALVALGTKTFSVTSSQTASSSTTGSGTATPKASLLYTATPLSTPPRGTAGVTLAGPASAEVSQAAVLASDF